MVQRATASGPNPLDDGKVVSILSKGEPTYSIAVGKSRKDPIWTNQEYTWEDLAGRLLKTHRTAETHHEYISSPKSRQDEIKDVGGFVGGYLANGRRNAKSVTSRTILTLDIDETPNWSHWDNLTRIFGCEAVMYTTHKHTSAAPRYRVVMPLARPVNPDEYQGLIRLIAEKIGIEGIDESCFRPSQLMYWPSTSSDGEFKSAKSPGRILDPDEVLEANPSWEDTSKWPTTPREADTVAREIRQQANPLEKPGIVGYFCQAYNIHKAIAHFLKEIYLPSGESNRYTYAGGSTEAGLVTYNDIFAYSHHGTDPVSGVLCNAFDLVRLHNFGHLDEQTKSKTITRLPSWRAMVEFAVNLPEVKKQKVMERMKKAKKAARSDVHLAVNNLGDRSLDWAKDLEVDKKGCFLSTIPNIRAILENDPNLKDTLYLDVFAQRKLIVRPLPWDRQNDACPRSLTDSDHAQFRCYLEQHYGLYSTRKTYDAIEAVLSLSRHHPVREYLESCTWDGIPRLDTLLIDYLGARDTPYVRAVTRKAVIAGVTRIFRPGCKFDNVLTLVGPQGIGKSSLAAKLGGPWFSDNLGNINSKDGMEALRGVWIMEIGEMSSLRKAEVEAIKHFISKQSDDFRPAYGHETDYRPRQSIFIASTNEAAPLKDKTGNRRFWPIQVGRKPALFDLWADLTEDLVLQIWGEAVEGYKAGELLHLDAKMEKAARGEQERFTEEDPRQGMIEEYLERSLPEKWDDMRTSERIAWLDSAESGTVRRDVVSVAEIWVEVLLLNKADMNTINTKSIHAIMSKMEGWYKPGYPLRRAPYGKVRAYVRI